MGELGDVFELIVVGPTRISSFRADARRTFRRDVRTYRVWWAGGERIRVEGYGGAPAGEVLYVQDGLSWWHLRDGTDATTNTLGNPGERPPVPEAVHMLMTHARLALDARVQIVGREEVAGREAIALGTPEREIAVDAEYGVTLRAVHGSERFWEVAEIVFDEPIPDGCFEFVPPPGVELRAASFDRSVPMPVDEVASKVDFPLFAPGPISITWPVEAHLWPARGERPECVTVRLREAPIWVQQSARPDPQSFGNRFPTAGEWRHIVRDGFELEVREDPAVVRLIRDGVHLEVYGEADDAEQLVAIALALRPVPRG